MYDKVLYCDDPTLTSATLCMRNAAERFWVPVQMYNWIVNGRNIHHAPDLQRGQLLR